MARKLLTIKEISAQTGMKPWLIRSAIRRGELPQHKVGTSRAVVVAEPALAKWLATRKHRQPRSNSGALAATLSRLGV